MSKVSINLWVTVLMLAGCTRIGTFSSPAPTVPLEPTGTEAVEAEGSAITKTDAGSLAWPVEEVNLIYRFGRDQQPNGTVLRWNGIGLAAPPGTPVHAVQAGRVALAGHFEGYGPTVVVNHGERFYTLYLYLDEINVVEGHDVVAEQVVGTVGGADTPEGPHLEFQIRAPLQGSPPMAQDPLRWLRPQDNP